MYRPSCPLVAVSILWIWLLQPRFGLINTLLYFLSIKGPNWLGDPAWSKPGLVIMNLTGVGINMVIFLAALQGVPTHLYEAAELDGANRLRKFWHVTIPMISPAIFFVAVIGFINSFQVFTQAYIMTEGGPADSTLFYVLYLYRHAFQLFQDGLCLGHGLAVVRCHRRPDLYPVPAELKVGLLWRSIEAWAMSRSGPRPRSASTAPRV